ncbi:galactose oxidase [Phtheirospermum japonicum]|uniref:Galactose oxidase n=1 Tax=Phtheirospermum japonicum TaxID=374723 RepID=A0A830CJA6_9LAMI|nr:galactose oxidase [Phtheirospermum japonicum]
MALNPTLNILSSALIILLLLLHPRRSILTRAASGKWDLLQSSIGIVAMHMQLLHTDRVVIYDRTDYGYSNISLPGGKCRHDPADKVVHDDCTAHSVEYDVAANAVRPLMVLTDVWCSSGAVMPDGTLAQAGGFNDGDRVVRLFKPCRDNACEWNEIKDGLVRRRWYSTSHVLPGGRQIIVGGRRQFNYEFYPKTASSTNDYQIENNLYPFVFLNLDGNLFVFANNRAILLDFKNNKVVRTYPEIPGGDPRNYPSTGSAVLLPLKDNVGAEVLLCGGAPKGAYVKANYSHEYVGALNTCGRIRINDMNPQWAMETMPMGRVMGDMLLLPDGNVLIVNGAGKGTAGWEVARDPVFEPVVYRPDSPAGSRFEVQNPSSIPRMYHSSAILLRDGRVLVGGSNPYALYRFTGVLFPTDLSLESFSPSYLDPDFAYLRPKIISPGSQSEIGYGQQVPIRFSIPPGKLDRDSVMVHMVAPSFTTHSFSMNQRLLVLTRLDLKAVGNSTYQIRVVTPGTSNLAPSGYYLVFVVHRNIPSEAIWVQIQ